MDDIDQVHVAQQSRRDKLREFHHNDTNNHLGSVVYANNLDQLPLNYTNNESSHFRTYSTTSSRPAAGNICYDPSLLCPEILIFSDKQRTRDDHEEPNNSFINFPRTVTCNSTDSSFNTWKSIGGSQQSMTSSSDHDNYNRGPTLVGENMSGSSLHVRSYLPFQEWNSPNLTNSNSLHCSSSIYQNTLQQLVTSSSNSTQALSLSLSSLPSPKIHASQVYEGGNIGANIETSRSHSHGQDMTGNLGFAHRNHGPLGPFTGYATILKSSKYLMPAQQIMDEMCSVAPRPKNIELREVSNKFLDGDEVLRYTDSEHGGGMSSSTDSYRPENLHKKAKLLYMQDEVCKRYTQYHQQMQMVISSFESVAGLSAATPYISLALKTISKHFSCLKNAITDQVKGLRNALGEDISFPTRKCDNNMGSSSMIKFFDQTFQKQPKGTATNLGILQEGQHVWRPQRGLPERAVSILRCWLFDHFLHPYPTDTDKHMLASQTGLTRNQVSNWFINARVRVWKPMVEEIHMLETKGVSGTGLDSSKTDGKSTSECAVDYQEKRSRIEYHVPSSVEGSFMGGFGGLGAVSLTLGLRQSVEGGASQRTQFQQDIRRQQLGGWDLVG